jgi:predicted NAD-dependent protein-ADP-ribosyltransferase YbiA (DUF1768 family)
MTHAKAATVLKREASKARMCQSSVHWQHIKGHLMANALLSVPKPHLEQRSILESNAERSWLDDAENEVIVNKLIHSVLWV